MVEAIRFVLEEAGWRAGASPVGYLSLDDSNGPDGWWDPARSRRLAAELAGREDVVAVLGTFNSGSVTAALPVLNAAPGGGLALVSPANTHAPLTEPAPGFGDNEPEEHYPSGQRTYLRVHPNDLHQGAALAQLARDVGAARAAVLHDAEPYGLAVAESFRRAARSLGIAVVAFDGWQSGAGDHEAALRELAREKLDALVLAGVPGKAAGALIEAKVAALGSNERVKLLASDGFLDDRTPTAGASAEMLVVLPGVRADQLPPAARRFTEPFAASRGLAVAEIDRFAPYAAQAAEIVLGAIARSDASRAGVVQELFATEIRDGILGSFVFDANGDPVSDGSAVTGFTVYSAGADGFAYERTLLPTAALVAAARQ